MSSGISSVHARSFPAPTDVIRAVESHEFCPLVDKARRTQILTLAEHVPVPSQTVCYEARLSEHDDRVDLALCVFPRFGDGITAALARLGQLHGEDLAWRRCVEFLSEWAAPDSQLLFQIPFTWIAFDLEPGDASLPAPCLGVCVDKDFFARRLGAESGPPISLSELEALTDACYRRLYHEVLPASCRTGLAQCLSTGESVEPRHLSFMLSRTPPTFKLDVRLPVDRVAAFLSRIGWPGPASNIQASIRRLMPWDGHVQLNLVLHPELSQPLEVEFLTSTGGVSAAGRFAFLQRLVDARLCSVEKARVLEETWTNPVSRDDGRVVARSWYVKVRFQGDQPVEAKAYLGIMPRIWSGRPWVHESELGKSVRE